MLSLITAFCVQLVGAFLLVVIVHVIFLNLPLQLAFLFTINLIIDCKLHTTSDAKGAMYGVVGGKRKH